MDYKLSDFTNDEQEILKTLGAINPIFTLKEINGNQFYNKINNIKNLKKVLDELVKKGVVGTGEKKKFFEETKYYIYYGITANGEFYDAQDRYWKARELQDRVCP